jgi:uncharacterized protein
VLIAVIADTHLPRGARRLPEARVEWLSRADLILHAGDFSARSALEELRAVGAPVLAVHGNVDEPSLRRELPARRLVEAERARIGMLHDAGPRQGRLDRLRAAFPDAGAVVFGHSHLPLHEESGGFQIFNPGSPTERRRAPTRSMGLANVEDGRIRFELVELGA